MEMITYVPNQSRMFFRNCCRLAAGLFQGFFVMVTLLIFGERGAPKEVREKRKKEGEYYRNCARTRRV